MGFKEWLSKIAPDGAGVTWSNRSNADLDYGKFPRKQTSNKSGQVEIDPEKLYIGFSHKQKVDKDIKGDINGIPNTSPSQ